VSGGPFLAFPYNTGRPPAAPGVIPALKFVSTAAILLSLATMPAGLYLRYGTPFRPVEQGFLMALVVLNGGLLVLGLVLSLSVFLASTRSGQYRFPSPFASTPTRWDMIRAAVLAVLAAWAILLLLYFSSRPTAPSTAPSATAAKNQAQLKRLANAAIEYIGKHDASPKTLKEALDESEEEPPGRGDADYTKTGERSFTIRAPRSRLEARYVDGVLTIEPL
jgi:hypothetical protein